MDLPYYVYILLCADQRYYVGCTSVRLKRLARHEKGLVTSTIGRLPVICVSTIGFIDKSKAFAFENYLKSGSGRAFMGRHLI
ncbi:MAG: GIY-YIG nuclease family protein [Flavobacteriales bacterium]|jgi:predicted GIY-YIG superfamily endonuclease|nr:GIY-YIG nuclease family protein [Flavobacteriales bacterium]